MAHLAEPRRYAPWLWLLLFLFILRVLGQVLVVFWDADFLPPLEQWESGLLPYPLLLTSQVLIILLYAKACLDFSRGRGYFVEPNRRFGKGVLLFGSLYLAAMVLRLVVVSWLYPGEPAKWKLIPIFLHWVLAAFLLLVARYHLRASREQGTP